ncbi:hypothetical protein D9M71_191660 [compost metagenome]
MAVTVFGNVAHLVGRLDIERVVTQAGEQLPLIVQAQLILHIHRAALDLGMGVARHHHAPGMTQIAVGGVQVQRRHRGAARPGSGGGVQQRIAALAADLDAGEQAVLQAERIEATFQLDVVVEVAGIQVLLPVLARDLVGGRDIAAQVSIVEIAVELEHTQGLAQLPVVAQFIGEFRAQGLRLVVDEIVFTAVGGIASYVGRAPIYAGDATIRRAVVATVFVLHQPIQVGCQLPAHRGCE